MSDRDGDGTHSFEPRMTSPETRSARSIRPNRTGDDLQPAITMLDALFVHLRQSCVRQSGCAARMSLMKSARHMPVCRMRVEVVWLGCVDARQSVGGVCL